MGEQDTLRREVAYLRRMSEQTVARMLSLDAGSLVIRHELEQKRRGFALMAELTANLGGSADYRSIFVSVSRRINAALDMQRTAVLTPEPGAGKRVFRAQVLQGYPKDVERRILARPVEVTDELLDPERPALVNGADDADRLADFRQCLDLPYFIAVPVMLHGKAAAILVTGRLVEQIPFLTRLGRGDMETVQTVGAYLAAMLAGQRMIEAEERSRLMLDATPLSCTLWDEEYSLVDCNLEIVRLFGFSGKKEFLRRFVDLLPEFQPDGCSSKERGNALIRQAFASGVARSEFLLRKPDGEDIPAEVTMVRAQGGNARHVLAFMRDLREVKSMLAEILQVEDALRTARVQAEEAARAKSDFLANMSHELRTPLNAVLGMVNILSESGLTAKQREFVDKAEHSANLLLSIINDILDFSAMGAGKLQLGRAEFRLRDIAGRVLEVAQDKARGKNIALSLDIAPGTPERLVGDSPRLEQILLNLVDNAVKFTPAGEVEIRLSGRPTDDMSGRARLICEVADTGIGLSEELTEGIFEAFTQADSSLTRQYGGTGLGLAICCRLAQMMGGLIRCSSRPDQGSVFALDVLLDMPGVAAGPEKAGADESASLRGLRVLLAEDNEINRMVAVELLASEGIVTDTVVNGREAVDALRHAVYDLVLMDIQMPEMDGLTAARLIRAEPGIGALPIIAMTALATEADRETSLEAGMNEHLAKPIVPDLLFAALRRWDRRVRHTGGEA